MAQWLSVEGAVCRRRGVGGGWHAVAPAGLGCVPGDCCAPYCGSTLLRQENMGSALALLL